MSWLLGAFASNALFLVALAGLLLLAGGIAMKLDWPTALIVVGALLLVDVYLTETRSKSSDR